MQGKVSEQSAQIMIEQLLEDIENVLHYPMMQYNMFFNQVKRYYQKEIKKNKEKQPKYRQKIKAIQDNIFMFRCFFQTTIYRNRGSMSRVEMKEAKQKQTNIDRVSKLISMSKTCLSFLKSFQENLNDENYDDSLQLKQIKQSLISTLNNSKQKTKQLINKGQKYIKKLQQQNTNIKQQQLKQNHNKDEFKRNNQKESKQKQTSNKKIQQNTQQSKQVEKVQMKTNKPSPLKNTQSSKKQQNKPTQQKQQNKSIKTEQPSPEKVQIQKLSQQNKRLSQKIRQLETQKSALSLSNQKLSEQNKQHQQKIKQLETQKLKLISNFQKTKQQLIKNHQIQKRQFEKAATQKIQQIIVESNQINNKLNSQKKQAQQQTLKISSFLVAIYQAMNKMNQFYQTPLLKQYFNTKNHQAIIDSVKNGQSLQEQQCQQVLVYSLKTIKALETRIRMTQKNSQEKIASMQNVNHQLKDQLQNKDQRINDLKIQNEQLQQGFRDKIATIQAQLAIKLLQFEDIQRQLTQNKQLISQITHAMQKKINRKVEPEHLIDELNSYQPPAGMKLIYSGILNGQDFLRPQIISQCEKFMGRMIKKTDMLARYPDKNSIIHQLPKQHQPPNQDNNFAFIVFYKTKNNRVFGSFSEGMKKQTFFFSFNWSKTPQSEQQRKIDFYFPKESSTKYSPVEIYQKKYLQYGNGELRINCIDMTRISANSDCSGGMYYNFDWSTITNEKEEHKVPISEVELHRVEFQPDYKQIQNMANNKIYPLKQSQPLIKIENKDQLIVKLEAEIRENLIKIQQLRRQSSQFKKQSSDLKQQLSILKQSTYQRSLETNKSFKRQRQDLQAKIQELTRQNQVFQKRYFTCRTKVDQLQKQLKAVKMNQEF